MTTTSTLERKMADAFVRRWRDVERDNGVVDRPSIRPVSIKRVVAEDGFPRYVTVDEYIVSAVVERDTGISTDFTCPPRWTDIQIAEEAACKLFVAWHSGCAAISDPATWEHLNQMSECEDDEDDRPIFDMQSFTREVVDAFTEEMGGDGFRISHADRAGYWETTISRPGAVPFSIQGNYRTRQVDAKTPGRTTWYRHGEPIDRAVIREHIRLAREDAEPKTESPSNALAYLRGRVLHEYMSTGFFEEAGELIVTTDGGPMLAEDARGTIGLRVQEFTLCSPPFVEAIIGGNSRHFFLDKTVDRSVISEHVRSANRYARSILAQGAAHTVHVFSSPVMVGDPSALHPASGCIPPGMARAIANYTDDMPAVDVGVRRSTRKILTLDKPVVLQYGEPILAMMHGDGHHRALVMAELSKAIPEPFAVISDGFEECVDTDGRPCLVVDLSKERPATDDGYLDRGENREEWTARKTAELEARFSAHIRNTLREWPTYQGAPMTIHTQVDHGVFVLTLKPGKDTP